MGRLLSFVTGRERPKADGHLWATPNQQQSLGKSTEFVEGCATPIRRLSCFGRSDPFRMVFLDSPVRLAI